MKLLAAAGAVLLVELAVDAETGSMSSDELKEKVETAVRIVVGSRVTE